MDEVDHDNHPRALSSGLNVSTALTGLALGVAAVGAAVILAPHLLPVLGVGRPDLGLEAAEILHNPTGIAGGLNAALSYVPVVGEALAKGGLFTASAAVATGLGGFLLGQFIEKKESGKMGVKWGTVIKYAALATSALISLPTTLTAIGTGMMYLGMLLADSGVIGQGGSESVLNFVYKTIGTAGEGHHRPLFGLTGAIGALPHLFTCGMALLPAALSFSLFKEKNSTEATPEISVPDHHAIMANMQVDKPLAAGVPCQARLTLTYADSGRPVTADELAVIHTKKVHLLVADSSLRDYHHIHPTPTDVPGEFTFTFTPATNNYYSAWADCTLAESGQNYTLKTTLPSAVGRNIVPGIQFNSSAQKEGMSFAWQASAPLTQGVPSIVTINVSDAQSNPVTDLEPVMGAYAHLVGFSADGKSIVHSHPLDAEPQTATDRGGPHLRFQVEPESQGATQFYLQLRRSGKDIFVPFGQMVKAAGRISERSGSQQVAHWGHAM